MLDNPDLQARQVQILVAEDSPTQAERLRYVLEQQGYSVTVAANGREALSLAEVHKPTLILSDVIMPEMDGYELCSRIKSNPNLGDVPVILVTTLSDPGDVIRGLECRADNFIVKPFDERHLLSRVQFVVLNKEINRHERGEIGVEVFFNGRHHRITADRLQILSLLLSTYDAAVQRSKELLDAQEELRKTNASLVEANQRLEQEIDDRLQAEAQLRELNDSLEERVAERTAELSHSNEQLQAEIFQRESLNQQLLQSQKMEGIGKLAGGIAHDFNNVLTAVLGYSQLAQLKLPRDSPVQEDLYEIRRAGERAADMTRQLLAFARKQVIEPRVVNLGDLVGGMQKLVSRLLTENIELVIASDADLGQVKVDPGQMEQVIVNLSVNARDAMPDGGRLVIETRNIALEEAVESSRGCLPAGDYVVLSVSDSGCGMDEETCQQVFEPFFTTKENDKGTGLGLSTCHGIVNQSGGHIWVYSEVGTGTIFKIYLPRVYETADAIVAESATPGSFCGTETILLVEDEEVVRKLASRSLVQQGYNILEAENGQAALQLSAGYKDQIHLMVTDVVMPQMGGSQLAELMTLARPSMKVLFTSGYTDDAILHHAVLHGGSPFINKPFTLPALARKVREVLDQQIAA